ncbi:DUF2169 domain-containing protein [Niveibacterium sp. SC-1]|uniref:DUF2169 family type VI secretion system accessory protein n=1 Tax=Niveibacterium sp. SC-1 TaxID=3135646 RepID=UPI00311F3CE0
MKVLKPLRLGVLPRPFSWQGQSQLGIALYALIDLDAQARLHSEQSLWALLNAEAGEGAVLDLGLPKPFAEFLVTGNAYTCHQADKTRCAVRAQVGSVSKSLTVFGDRYWIAGAATAPQAFESMPLHWSRAYGGDTYAPNPLGRGFAEEEITTPRGAQRVRRMPNVESAERLIHTPLQTPDAPAGFGPVDFAWPQRQALLGQYGSDYLEKHFPGFSPSLDWRAFNAAPPDQLLPPDETLAGAPFKLWNMHPEQPVVEGHLPAWIGRCLVTRQTADGPRTDDLLLPLSTAWFFPHRRQAILIYHGSLPIAEDDAHDVLHLMPVLEHPDRLRPVADLAATMARRLDRQSGPNHALKDRELLPEGIALGPAIEGEDTMFERETGPRERNLRRRLDDERAEVEAMVRAEGMDPAEVLPPGPDDTQLVLPRNLEELSDFLAAQDAKLSESREIAHQEWKKGMAMVVAEGGESPLAPDELANLEALMSARTPEDLKKVAARSTPGRSFAEVADALSRADAAAADDESSSPDFMTQSARLREQMHRARLNGALHFGPAEPLAGLRAQLVRREVETLLAGSRDFTGLDLSGADLSGLDLSGACFHRAALEGADLRRSSLEGADLREAVLARARLHDSSLVSARCANASFAGVQAGNTDFSGAQLIDCDWQQAQLQDCRFVGARFEKSMLMNLAWRSCDFSDSQLEGISFYQCQLQDCRFERARLRKTSFIEGALRASSFEEADLEDCAFVTMEATGLRCAGIRMKTCAGAMDTRLDLADFSRAHLRQTNLRQTDLRQSRFEGAHLEETDLSEADLRGANLRQVNARGAMFMRTNFYAADLSGANLIQAILQGADLRTCDLREANLFQADLGRVRGDTNTRFEGAYTQRVKVWPRHKEGVL